MSATTIEAPVQETTSHAHTDHEVGFIRKYLWTYDHKMIGLQYLWTALAFLFLGGALALGVRWQLGFPGAEIPLIGRLLPATVARPGFYRGGRKRPAGGDPGGRGAAV